jgi:pyrroloquinoline quinone biosynthesis protein B
MIVRILGSAAGGGLPQWNCGCPNCAAVRQGSPDIEPRTQSSVAVSADGQVWFLLNVSPDIRQQILQFPALGCAPGKTRGTPIAGCILTDAELDHTIGLLSLREGESIGVYATEVVRRTLFESFPIADMLNPYCDRRWISLPIGTPTELRNPNGECVGLSVRAFALGGHLPRYADSTSPPTGSVVGLAIEDSASGGCLVYAPGIESLTSDLSEAAMNASCILADGTFWQDDELSQLGISSRTARQMGHWPVGGADGSLNWLGDLRVPHRVYVHINNTNPMLRRNSPERLLVESRGVRVGSDGDTITI